MSRRFSAFCTALRGGFSSAAFKDELTALEARKADLTRSLAGPDLPALHPEMAVVASTGYLGVMLPKAQAVKGSPCWLR